MPALFAYVLAVCVFLGGGYGALNWRPHARTSEVTARAKHLPPRTAKVYDAAAIKTTEFGSESGTLSVSPTTGVDLPSTEAVRAPARY